MIDFAALVDRFVGDAEDAALARRTVLGLSAGGASAATAFLETCRILGEAASDPAGLVAAVADIEEGEAVDRVGLLVVSCFAAVRVDHASRPDATAARAALSAQADAIYDVAGTLYGADVMAWLVALVGQAVGSLSELAASRAPLVRVETGVSLPSSLLAYDLYGDPSRGAELVARNRTGTPFVMPMRIEALAE